MDGYTDGQMGGWIDERVDGQRDKHRERKMDGSPTKLAEPDKGGCPEWPWKNHLLHSLWESFCSLRV